MAGGGRPLAVLFVASIIVACATVVVTQPACGGYPGKTCFGDKLNALLDVDGGADPRAEGCTKCLQAQESCDSVGACGDDPKCTAEFKDMQRCMLEQGPGKQVECKRYLTVDGGSGKSQPVYTLVRNRCGPSCGIPSCEIDPAASLFVTTECDRCMTGACCEQINVCYKSRQCQLFLECITDHCSKTIGTSLSQLEKTPAEFLDGIESTLCLGTPLPKNLPTADPNDTLNAGTCLNRCLREFATPEAGLPEDNQAAACRAVGVYVCGAKSKCGDACKSQGDPIIGSYPEDNVDAGAIRDGGGD